MCGAESPLREIVGGELAAHIEHKIIIRAPLDFVWDISNDLSRWPALFQGHYAAAEILEEAPGRLRFRLTTCPDEEGRTYSWVSERFLDASRHRVLARRIDPGPFLYMHIFQSFDQVADGTAVRWVHDFEMLPRRYPTDAEMAAHIEENAAANLSQHKIVIERLVGPGVGGPGAVAIPVTSSPHFASTRE